MHVEKKLERIVKFILDDCVPPVLRDQRAFMSPLFRLIFGRKAKHFVAFRENILKINHEQILTMYKEAQEVAIHQHGSDLSGEMLKIVSSAVVGERILDAGGGNALLGKAIGEGRQVTVCDIVLDDAVLKANPDITFRKSRVEDLPFETSQFDTVISTHTLEHVPDIASAVAELRRVAKERLIVVLPKERPYRFAFNYHLHFFPYEYSVACLFSQGTVVPPGEIKCIGDSWYYQEDVGP